MVKFKLSGLSIGDSEEFELKKAPEKEPIRYRPKTPNMDTLGANARQNPSGNIYIAELERQRMLGEMTKHPRLFRKDSTYISK